MMSLGRFASVGVVKGLGSVDVKNTPKNRQARLQQPFPAWVQREEASKSGFWPQ